MSSMKCRYDDDGRVDGDNGDCGNAGHKNANYYGDFHVGLST